MRKFSHHTAWIQSGSLWPLGPTSPSWAPCPPTSQRVTIWVFPPDGSGELHYRRDLGWKRSRARVGQDCALSVGDMLILTTIEGVTSPCQALCCKVSLCPLRQGLGRTQELISGSLGRSGTVSHREGGKATELVQPEWVTVVAGQPGSLRLGTSLREFMALTPHSNLGSPLLCALRVMAAGGWGSTQQVPTSTASPPAGGLQALQNRLIIIDIVFVFDLEF